MKLLTWMVFAFTVGACVGVRILALVPMPSRSHSILMERLLGALGERGHDVTYIAATIPSKPLSNVQVIHVPGIRDAMMKSFSSFANSNSSSLFAVRNINPWFSLMFGHMMSESMCDHILNFTTVRELVLSNAKFDLILGEIMLDESILAGFAYRFQAPIVAFATTVPSHFSNYLVGNPAPSAYVPQMFLGYSSKMTFWERFYNFVYGLATDINHRLRYLPRHDQIMRNYFGKDIPYIGDILKNTSLVLVNHHHALGFPRAYLPNMVEIAGVHINEPKALPQNLKSFMDNAKNGVILFSLGTNVNSSDMPYEKILSILEGFAQLKEDVIWKFEATLKDVPSNVKIMKWVPQSDLLAHKNLKVFITHGGLLSTTEAMSHGVPVVGIPIMGDQYVNMKQVQDAGWGLLLPFDAINKDTLYQTVLKVVQDNSFKEKASLKSRILNDNLKESLDRAVWWIEYVARHLGAPHLRSASQDLTWSQLHLLDVYAVAVATVLSLLIVNLYVIKFLFKKLM